MPNVIMKPCINSGTSANCTTDSNKRITITTLQERLFFEGNLVWVSAGTKWERRSAHGVSGRGTNGHIRVYISACSIYTFVFRAMHRYLHLMMHSSPLVMQYRPVSSGIGMAVSSRMCFVSLCAGIKARKAPVKYVMSVCLSVSACINSAPTG